MLQKCNTDGRENSKLQKVKKFMANTDSVTFPL